MSNQKLSFNKSTISKQVATAVQGSSRMISMCVCVCVCVWEKKEEESRVIHKTKMATWNGIISSDECYGRKSHSGWLQTRVASWVETWESKLPI